MEIKKTMQNIFDKGLELSKKMYDKARGFGGIGIAQVEIIALQHKMAKQTGKLGALAYKHLSKKTTALKKDAKGVPALLKKIKDIKQKIKLKEKELKNKRN